MSKIIEFFADRKLPFPACKRCRHKKYCNHRVWTNEFSDCNYWKEKVSGMKSE